MAITSYQILIMKKSMLFCFIILNLKVMEQAAVNGEYYLNKREMVAGFNFLNYIFPMQVLVFLKQ